MNQCKDCKWWDKKGLKLYNNNNNRKIEAKFCDHPQLAELQRSEDYSVVPINGFGIDYPICGLATGPEFGCTNWERKETD